MTHAVTHARTHARSDNGRGVDNGQLLHVRQEKLHSDRVRPFLAMQAPAIKPRYGRWQANSAKYAGGNAQHALDQATLEGKVVMITGANSGVGKELSRFAAYACASAHTCTCACVFRAHTRMHTYMHLWHACAQYLHDLRIHIYANASARTCTCICTC